MGISFKDLSPSRLNVHAKRQDKPHAFFQGSRRRSVEAVAVVMRRRFVFEENVFEVVSLLDRRRRLHMMMRPRKGRRSEECPQRDTPTE